MPITVEGLTELAGNLNRMADALNTADEGAPAARRILKAAAVPIDTQMKANASRDPKIIGLRRVRPRRPRPRADASIREAGLRYAAGRGLQHHPQRTDQRTEKDIRR